MERGRQVRVEEKEGISRPTRTGGKGFSYRNTNKAECADYLGTVRASGISLMRKDAGQLIQRFFSTNI